MNSPLFSEEQDLANQMLAVLQSFKLWILVAAAAGALAAVLYSKTTPKYAEARAVYTLAEHKVAQLAAVYDKLPAQTSLMLGALEVDEMARFTLLLDHPLVWQQLWQNAALCQAQSTFCAGGDTGKQQQLTATWRSKFAYDHKRRGNQLTVKWRAPRTAEAEQLLSAMMQSAEAEYKTQAISQYRARQADLQQALEKAATVGERSELSVQLDKVQAELNVLQHGRQAVLHAVQPVTAKEPRNKPLLFIAVVGALLSALGATLLALVFSRR